MPMTTREPEFMICLECETPCYTFEWNMEKERVIEAFCQVCGNDRIELFNTEQQFMGEEE